MHFTIWQWIFFGVIAVIAVVVDFSYGFMWRMRAMNRGYGKGRDAVDWALRGQMGLDEYNIFGPDINDKDDHPELKLQHMFCPKCQKMRLVNDGFCTVCGTEVLKALVDEANVEEAQVEEQLGEVRVLTYDDQLDQLHNPKQKHPGDE